MEGMRDIGKFRCCHVLCITEAYSSGPVPVLKFDRAKVTHNAENEPTDLSHINHLTYHVSFITSPSKFRKPIFFSLTNPSAYFAPILLPSIRARAITL